MCVAAGWWGRMSLQGTWGSRRTGQAATGPMVTAATVDASAVRSAALYCLTPAVSRARCRQAPVQATTPQFVPSGSAQSALLLPPCCIMVVVSSGGPCSSAFRTCPGGRANGAGCGKLCALRRSGCVWYGFCRRWSGAARGRKRSWCRYQWPCAVDGFWTVSQCSTTCAWPQRGAAIPGGPGSLTCPQAECGPAGEAPVGVPAPGLAPRGGGPCAWGL